MRTQGGYSLLELLIVLALGSTLLLAIYQLFFYYQQQYYHVQAVLTTQENTRFALHLLHNAIQTAGEAGCLSSVDLALENQVVRLPMPLKISSAVYGHTGENDQWDPPLPVVLTTVAAGTDVVLTEKAAYERAHLAQAMQDQHDPIYINDPELFVPGDIVLIADCSQADLFQVSAVQNSATGQVLQHLMPENHRNELSHVYGRDAQVMRWQVDAYYIAPTSRDPQLLALYQHTLLPARAAMEWVAGIEKLVVTYAVLENNTPVFVDAGMLVDDARVHGLTIQTLAYAQQTYTQKQMPYFWLTDFILPEKAGYYAPAQITVPLYNQEVQ